jgi:ribulose-5-phosphate 4-epimerase/fuculose-1-phosphate aldolase
MQKVGVGSAFATGAAVGLASLRHRRFHCNAAKLCNAAAGGGNAKMKVARVVTDLNKFDEQLWSVRKELALAYRAMYKMGLNTFTYNHLTVDCGQNRFLVNRYGLSWNEVTAENLLLVNSEGIILEGEGPVMQAAFVIHAMVHSEKKEMAKVVFHTHQCAATALTACVQTKYSHLTEELSCLPMVTQSCLDFAGRTMYDPVYTGIANDLDEGKRIADAMQDRPILFMGNHGITLCAGSVAEALYDIWRLEEVCNEVINRLGADEPLPASLPNLSQVDNAANSRRQAAQSFFRSLADHPDVKCPWDGRGEFRRRTPHPPSFLPAGVPVKNAPAWGDFGATWVVVQAQALALAPVSMTMELDGKYLTLASQDGAPACVSFDDVLTSGAVRLVDTVDNGVNRRVHASGGELARLVLVATPPASAARLAAMRCMLLPCVQDAMLFDGYLALVDVGAASDSHDSSAEAKAKARSSANNRLVEVLTTGIASDQRQRNVRIAVTSDGLTMAIAANGPAHLLALLERFEKCCALQLKAMKAAGIHSSSCLPADPIDAAAAVKRVLRLIDPAVVMQPRNGFLCATTDPEPAAGQMQLEAYKRMAGW